MLAREFDDGTSTLTEVDGTGGRGWGGPGQYCFDGSPRAQGPLTKHKVVTGHVGNYPVVWKRLQGQTGTVTTLYSGEGVGKKGVNG